MKQTNTKKIYKYAFLSIAISFLGFIPLLNIVIILPFSFYLGLKAFKLARNIPKENKKKRLIAMVVSAYSMLNAGVVWIIAFSMFLLISFGFIEV